MVVINQPPCYVGPTLNLRTVAHPILAGIETKFMASYGRDWLRHPHAARLAIVVGSRNVNGLKMFDPRMAWQLTSSIFTICGTVSGAFILSCKPRILIQTKLSTTNESIRLYAYCGTWLPERRLSGLHGNCVRLDRYRDRRLVAYA